MERRENGDGDNLQWLMHKQNTKPTTGNPTLQNQNPTLENLSYQNPVFQDIHMNPPRRLSSLLSPQPPSLDFLQSLGGGAGGGPSMMGNDSFNDRSPKSIAQIMTILLAGSEERVYNGSPYELNNIGLGLPRSTSSNNANHHFLNLQRGPQGSGATINQYVTSSSSNSNNDQFDWHPRRRQTAQAAGYNNRSRHEERGQVPSVARQQNNIRFLLKKFQEDREVIDIHDLHEVMVDQYGSYEIMKQFEASSEEKLNKFLLILGSNAQKLKDICTDNYGSQSFQKFLKSLKTPKQISVAMLALRRLAVTLTKCPIGQHVIQCCLKIFSIEDYKHVLIEVAAHCHDIATDKTGCCALQHFIANINYREVRDRFVFEIATNALVLSEHPYGNYVVQYILGLRIPRVTADIVVQLEGSIITLSMNKYGSNVVEKLLKDAGEEYSSRIIMDLIISPNLLNVVLNNYGNFVVQAALDASKKHIHHALVAIINRHSGFLQSHLFGKRVLAKARVNKHHG